MDERTRGEDEEREREGRKGGKKERKGKERERNKTRDNEASVESTNTSQGGDFRSFHPVKNGFPALGWAVNRLSARAKGPSFLAAIVPGARAMLGLHAHSPGLPLVLSLSLSCYPAVFFPLSLYLFLEPELATIPAGRAWMSHCGVFLCLRRRMEGDKPPLAPFRLSP